MDAVSLGIEAAGRWAVYLALLPLLGLLSWRLLLWPRVYRLRELSEPAGAELDRRLAVVGVLVGLALLLALGFRALCQTANTFGLDGALNLDNLHTVAIESRWGRRLVWQAWAACGSVAAFAWIRVHARSGWSLAALAGLALCVALPRTGHAMSHGTLALGAQALHVLGAVLWIGTLAVALTARRLGLMVPSQGRRAHSLAEVLSQFAPVATAGAAALGASGVLTAYLYLPDPASLVTTSWGRALLVKVALVAVVGLLGFFNFRRFRRLAPHDLSGASLGLAKIELAVALGIVLLTGVLTALPSAGG